MRKYFLQLSGGTTPGPFDVYLSGSSGETLYQADVSQIQLQAGISVEVPDNVPSSSIVVYNNSYGCSNEVQVIFPTPPVSITPSLSISPTVTPSISPTPSTPTTSSRRSRTIAASWWPSATVLPSI